jgi:hypothetical protein
MPKVLKAARAMTGSTAKSANRIVMSITPELINIITGIMMLLMTVLTLPEIPLIMALLFRAQCTAYG